MASLIAFLALSDLTLVGFHLLFVLLAFEAFYLSTKAFVARLVLGSSVAVWAVARAVSERRLPSEETVEIPLLIALVGIVFMLTRSRDSLVGKIAARESDLRALHERFESLVDSVPAVVYMAEYGAAGRWLYASGRTRDVMGVDPQQLMDDPLLWADLLHPEDRERVLAEEVAARESGTGYRGDYRIVTPAGETVWVRDEANLVVSDLGEPVWQGVLYEVGQVKRSQALLEARARQQAAVAALGSRAMAGTSVDELLDAAVELVGQTLGTEMTKVLELQPDGKKLRLRAGTGWEEGIVGVATVSAGASSQAGYTLRSGVPVVVEDLAHERRFEGPSLLVSHGVVSGMSVVIPDNGKHFGVLGTHSTSPRSFTAEDVSFLESVANILASALRADRVERASKLQQTIFRAAFEKAVSGMAVLETDGRFRAVNEAMCSMLGYAEGELLRTDFQSVTHPEDLAECMACADEIRRGSCESGRLTKRYIHRDGSDVWSELSLALARDDSGEPLYFIAVSHDITDRIKAEQDRESLEEHLRHAQKMDAIGRLAGGVAHDFNNLLAVIISSSELLLQEIEEPSPLRADLLDVLDAAERAADLTRQLLTVSRREAGKPQVIDVAATIRGIEKLLRRSLTEGVRLSLQLGSDLGPVLMDPSHLEQLVLNLVVNARDAMPGGGSITISLEEAEAGLLSLRIADEGTGMAPELVERIFEPFFTTKERGRGTGLGLATVYAMVERAGGRIDVSSEPGSGTTFTILLPTVDGEVTGAPAPAPVRPAGGVRGTVLVAEDDPLVRRAVERILSRRGFHVISAASGPEAIRLVRGGSVHVDVLLTDIVMPDMSGRQLAQAMVAMEPGLKVLYMSGYADLQEPGVLEDDERLIRKPFVADSLIGEIEEVLSA